MTDNSALRLHRFISALSGQATLVGASEALGLHKYSPEELVQRIAEAFTLVNELSEDIEVQARNEREREHWRETAQSAWRCVGSITMRLGEPPVAGGSFSITIPKNLLTGLKFIGSSFLEESEIEDEVSKLRECLSELQQILKDSETLSPSMKRWLQDVVRIIRDSIDRYDTFGSRGMKKHFHELVGQLVLTWRSEEEVRNSKETEPGIWEQLDRACAIFERIVFVIEKGPIALNYASQFLLPMILN